MGGFLYAAGLSAGETICTVACSTLNVANAFNAANVESCIMTAGETAPSAIVCNAGFLKKGIVECIAPPSTGCTAVDGTGLCTTCDTAGYVKNGNVCVACASAAAINDVANTARYTCTFASGAPVFTACANNHYKGLDNKCYKVDSNCSHTADTDSASTVNGDGVCDNNCNAGITAGNPVYLDATTKKCTACPTGCTACSNATTCSTCDNGDGYYLNTSGGTSCVKPSLKCLTWAFADKCGSCPTNAYITATFTCTTCATGCATCSSTVCTSC